VAVGQLGHGHGHARGAEAALEPEVVHQRTLDRVQLAVLRKSLDGGDLGPVGLDREHHAGLDHAAVQVHRAGAAHAVLAGALGPGQAQLVAQQVAQQALRRDGGRGLTAVDGQADAVLTHVSPPPRRRRRWWRAPGW
jgi:hypothetical protein